MLPRSPSNLWKIHLFKPLKQASGIMMVCVHASENKLCCVVLCNGNLSLKNDLKHQIPKSRVESRKEGLSPAYSHIYFTNEQAFQLRCSDGKDKKTVYCAGHSLLNADCSKEHSSPELISALRSWWESSSWLGGALDRAPISHTLCSTELSRMSGCARMGLLLLLLPIVIINHQNKYKPWVFPHVAIKYASSILCHFLH